MMTFHPTTTGIFFDAAPSDDAPFPMLADMPYAWVGESVPMRGETFGDWLAVAQNPARDRYFDDDQQAMDETNFEAVYEFRALESVTDAERLGVELDVSDVYLFGKVVIVRPNSEVVDAMVKYRSALSDYPLLDESAYSEREYDAWLEFMRNGLRYDTTSELVAAGVDDATIDDIDDAWDAVAPAAGDFLHHFNGWDGGHSPDFSVCVGKAVVTAVAVLFGHPRSSLLV
jgi:hypothetical protein